MDETGGTKTVSSFDVANNFDDGEERVFDPARRFTWFNLREGTDISEKLRRDASSG